LTVYGQTLWNLEALLHDTFGSSATCLRLRDYKLRVSDVRRSSQLPLLEEHVRRRSELSFKLVRRAHQPGMGNTASIRVKGLYVSCGNFPVAFATLAHEGSRTRRWLVVLHGWAMTPFTCLGQ
jgi:hypothetical protein